MLGYSFRDFFFWNANMFILLWLIKTPSGASGKEATCQCKRCKRLRFAPWLGRFPRAESGNPLQYSLFFFNLFVLLYSIVLVLPYIDMNQPWVFMCSPSWTPLPPLSPSHPSGSSQCTSPVSCIEPGLVIHFTYDSLHVSVTFSHIILPSPSPTESKRLFYTSVSLLLSHIQGYHYHLSKFHIYALVYYIGVFLSGLLHSIY